MTAPNHLPSSHTVLARLAGAILVFFGLLAATLCAVIAVRLYAHRLPLDVGELIGLGVFLGAALFFLSIGFRLAANRPNRYGSLLPPWGWYAMSVVVAGLGVLLVWETIAKREVILLIPSVLAFVLFTHWTYRAGRSAKRRLTDPSYRDEPTPLELGSDRKGFIRLLKYQGTELWMHWSILIGGLFVAALAGFDAHNVLCYSIGYLILVVVHEFGHAFAARMLGLKVLSIDFSGAGGLCRIEPPRRTRDAAIVFSAGVVAQGFLLLGTVGFTTMFGHPTSAAASSFHFTFTIANAVMIALNLIPRSIGRGLITDGSALWQLYLHAYKGKPHPFPRIELLPEVQSPVFPPETSLLSMPALIPEGFKGGVEILNDRTTPMQFVVECLVRHFGQDQKQAIATMAAIHNTGGILIPLPTPERAIFIATAVTADAKRQGHAFVCRAVIGNP